MLDFIQNNFSAGYFWIYWAVVSVLVIAFAMWLRGPD